MKRNQIKFRWGWALGLALLTAIPFTASAQMGSEKGESPKPKEIVIELEGKIRRATNFIFEGNTIQYKHDYGWYPTPATFHVNGILWEDLKTPFQLNFTPDFENASILEQSGHTVLLNKEKDRFTVRIEPGGKTEKTYKIRIAAKYQEKRENNQPKMIPVKEIKNMPSLSPNGETLVYGPMMVSRINEPTDGMDHPNYNVSRPVFPPNFYMGNKIEIKGTVDKKASFRLDGLNIVYQNYTALPMGATGNNPVRAGGKFASGVTVNGKAWTNLARPFGANIPDIGAFREISFNADNCSVSYSYHHNVIEITITNKDTKPVPFVITALFSDSHFD